MFKEQMQQSPSTLGRVVIYLLGWGGATVGGVREVYGHMKSGMNLKKGRKFHSHSSGIDDTFNFKGTNTLRAKFLRLHFEGVVFKREPYLLALVIDRN